MLPTQHRMRTSTLFEITTRSGAKQGRRNVVVYIRPTAKHQPIRVGFIVSKAVGNAVTRNKVKRRLRSFAENNLRTEKTGYDVVIRALTPAARASFVQLVADCSSAWVKAKAKAFTDFGDGHDR